MHELMSSAERLVYLSSWIKTVFTLLSICSLRLLAVFLVLPATSDSALQGPLRNGFALLMGTYIAWGQPADLLANLSIYTVLAIALKETLIGIMIGMAASSVFWIAEGVGVLIDNEAGYNSIQQTNPLNGQQSTPVSNLLGQLAISAFYVLGGMTTLLGVLFSSYKIVPLDRLTPSVPDALELFAGGQATAYLTSVILIASPVILVLVLIDLGIGLLNKTAEKLEPNNLTQPIKGLVTMLMLSLLVAVFFQEARPRLAMHDFSLDLRRLAGRLTVPGHSSTPSMPPAADPN